MTVSACRQQCVCACACKRQAGQLKRHGEQGCVTEQGFVSGEVSRLAHALCATSMRRKNGESRLYNRSGAAYVCHIAGGVITGASPNQGVINANCGLSQCSNHVVRKSRGFDDTKLPTGAGC